MPKVFGRARIEVHVSGEHTSCRLVVLAPSLACMQALFRAEFNLAWNFFPYEDAEQAFSVPSLVGFTAAHWLRILDDDSRPVHLPRTSQEMYCEPNQSGL